MSEFINNREHRQKMLKEIIMELHNGKTADEVKTRFEELSKGVSASEIAEMEQALIKEGMPVSEIQRLCDVHAAVFKGSIAEIHREQKPEETPGHPVHTLKLENREIEKQINDRIKPLLEKLKTHADTMLRAELLKALGELAGIDRHYAKKENLLFPFMEKHGITAPPKVMWGVDDEIRNDLKEAKRLLNSDSGADAIITKTEEAVNKAVEMVFKEESIMIPMVLEALGEDEWLRIRDDSDEFGYFGITPGSDWKPAEKTADNQKEPAAKPAGGGAIDFEPGQLSPEEIKWIFNTLPVDITFVDKNGNVKYFTQGKERIFARPASVIGRQVSNCHPPASVHVVEKIVEELKSGKKDNEDFWIKMGGQYVHIRYFAVRDGKGEFLGVMEFTQNIKPIQEITGEKRLVTE
jgi:PAS domain S-box-containing protein